MPKLRIFAGPNGSGKTTLYNSIKHIYFSTKLFVNADMLEENFNRRHFLDFLDFDIQVTDTAFQTFSKNNGIYTKAGFSDDSWNLTVKSNVLVSSDPKFGMRYNSYHFAVIADFIRHYLIAAKQSFSFETVFSHPSKLGLIDLAIKNGYKVYLYFIGTESPNMNIERVKDRIQKGGHPVNEHKIANRYFLTMNILLDILKKVHEAYLWDNSGQKHKYIGAFKNGEILFDKALVPEWIFTYILDKTGKAEK